MSRAEDMSALLTTAAACIEEARGTAGCEPLLALRLAGNLADFVREAARALRERDIESIADLDATLIGHFERLSL